MPSARANWPASMPCSARGKPATVSADLAPLISRAIELHRRSGGLLRSRRLRAGRLWQFDRRGIPGRRGPARRRVQKSGRCGPARAPSPTCTSTAAPCATRPLCIDLGGMAKGTALERARGLLVQHGASAMPCSISAAAVSSRSVPVAGTTPGRSASGIRADPVLGGLAPGTRAKRPQLPATTSAPTSSDWPPLPPRPGSPHRTSRRRASSRSRCWPGTGNWPMRPRRP